jgi:hypothetical protein
MKAIAYISLIIIFSACSVFKHVDKTAVKTDVRTEETTDKVTVLTEKTIEILDTSVLIKGSKAVNDAPAADILRGDSLISENNDIKGVVTYDKATGELVLKAEAKRKIISVKKTVERTKMETVNTNTILKTDIKTKATESKKTVFRLPWWLWLVPVGIVLFYYRKKILPLVSKFLK